MKKILGLDLGSTSIGWSLVNRKENDQEESSIIKLGVRVNPLTTDEIFDFEKGKSLTTNAKRTLKRSMRKNLYRYKLRRSNLISILKKQRWINDETILSENGNKTTFETYRLRAKAVTQEVTLEQFARILLMINKKRGYKSCRKVKSTDEDQLINSMEIAKKLYEENITPGELLSDQLNKGRKYHNIEFYRSDLETELNRIWAFQKQFYPNILTEGFKQQIEDKSKKFTVSYFLKEYGIYTAEIKTKDKKAQICQWRVNALTQQLDIEIVALIICELIGDIYNSSGYLGRISDRSKELFFNKQTVGQYLMKRLDENPQASLKNRTFYRTDYLNEFNTIWETQRKFHKELTDDLKSEIRDIVIFYQRRLKSQKGLVSFCEFESKPIEIIVDGKKKIKITGAKVCPKSSPFFQEFKIWQTLNIIEIKDKKTEDTWKLRQEEKDLLFSELNLREKLSKSEVLKLLYKDYRRFDLNFEQVEGNRTQATLFKAYKSIIETYKQEEYDFSDLPSSEIKQIIFSTFKMMGYKTDILTFNPKNEPDKEPMYKLWHLLYSYEGDDSNTGYEKLIRTLSNSYGFTKEHATILANISFSSDYGSLSTKAIRKILKYLKKGENYSSACESAGYRHSKDSLTKEEKESKKYKDKLELLPKNSLRNPVIEKILNQMVNVVNLIIDEYGKPDEIHIELARELKKSAKERERMTRLIKQSSLDYERFRKKLQNEFGISHPSRNDIIRYRLYEELAPRGFKTLYSNTYIPKEKIFSKEFNIEHIIPQSRLFDDSFSNKTLEVQSVNIEKGSDTAYDYIENKKGIEKLNEYLANIEGLFQSGNISKTKYLKLKMKSENIPSDFIERDLRESQYIAKKAKEMLEELVKTVVSTTGAITDRLREDWQLIDIMKELNWGKYDRAELTETFTNRDGQTIRKIKDWNKRNDHRNHAMDALTIAFTKPEHINYLNNLNARSDKSGNIYKIEKQEMVLDTQGKRRFIPPIPLGKFRKEAKKHLENMLVSIKAKNKVTTININKTKTKNGENKHLQLTPRGQLHEETIYGRSMRYETLYRKVDSSFTAEQISFVAKKSYREALLSRLKEFENDPKKAFTGKNSLEKNPVYTDETQTESVPQNVKLVYQKTLYTIRKEITQDLKIEKVIDSKIRNILEERLKEYDGDNKKAFSNLDENPIWLNREKGIAIKRVTISGPSNVEALHTQKDKDGKIMPDNNNKPQPTDYVLTGNNHHVAIYQDENGKLQDNIVSFMEATARVTQNLPIIDKQMNADKGWKFLFSIKQNEYFVFPNNETGFDPKEIDLKDENNYKRISPNLFRVQSISRLIYGNSVIREYKFRHHLETSIQDNKLLKDTTYKPIKSLIPISEIVKVRINSIGKIVDVGEY